MVYIVVISFVSFRIFIFLIATTTATIFILMRIVFVAAVISHVIIAVVAWPVYSRHILLCFYAYSSQTQRLICIYTRRMELVIASHLKELRHSNAFLASVVSILYRNMPLRQCKNREYS